MIPSLIEVQEYFIEKEQRCTKATLQFFSYYNAVGWPQDLPSGAPGWKKAAYRYFKKNENKA